MADDGADHRAVDGKAQRAAMASAFDRLVLRLAGGRDFGRHTAS